MNTKALSHEIIKTCQQLQAMGLVVGTYGNVSVRIENGFIITPSRIDYQEMSPPDLVKMTFDGAVVDGVHLPSSEMDVHRQVYLHRGDVGAVIHTHSLHATTIACLGWEVPVFVEEQSQVIGGSILCTRYVPAGQHERLGEEIAGSLSDSNALLLANHGVLCFGRTLAEALFTSIVTERICTMYLLAKSVGKPSPIPHEFVLSERERFLYKYGNPADRQ